MNRRRSSVLAVALIGLTLAACGSAQSTSTPTASKKRAPSAFDKAFQAALVSVEHASAPSAPSARVLRAHPKELAAAIKASMTQQPWATALQGAPALRLVADLPASLATSLVEQSIAVYGQPAPVGYAPPQAFLLQEIRTGPTWAVSAALTSALQDAKAGSAFWLKAYEALPSSDAQAAAYSAELLGTPGILAQVLADPRIAPAVKQAVLQDQYVAASASTALTELAQSTSDPALKEQALVDLAQSGAPGSIKELAALTDQHHTFPGIVWPASLMTAVKQADPTGYIAQGMDAVSNLTGTAYVDVHRCIPKTHQCGFWLEGPAQYNPAKLAQWQVLLSRFRQHPGSDDIAYVIGRIDEIDHHYGAAVLAFEQALALPDGGMRHAAASRLVWVLDVEMTGSQIAVLAKSAPIGLRPLLHYAEAVHLLREGNYSEAIAGLRAAAGKVQAITAAFQGVTYRRSPFLNLFIAWQLHAAEHLQVLAHASGTAPGAFTLAQYTFQNPMLYYMGLWQGTRAAYIAFASGGTYPTPAWMHYQTQFNNYVVAARLYAKAARLAGSNAALRAKDLYGEGESLVELLNYGSGTDLYPPDETYSKAEALLRSAAAADPHGRIGGSALMSLFYLTGQRSLLQKVLKNNAGTSAAYDAKLREEPVHHYTATPPSGPQPMDFQPLWTSNPLSSQEQSAMAQDGGTGSVVLGQETLLSIQPSLPPGEEPAVVAVKETAPGQLLVEWNAYQPADVPGMQPVYFSGKAYARVFGVFHAVRFERVHTGTYFGY